jgi:hypothetical protein
MRLSDAIALGRTLLKPKAYQTIHNGEGCALGMAMASLGCRSHAEAQKKCSSTTGWKWVRKDVDVPPCSCDPEYDRILAFDLNHQAYIAHLFNEHVCGAEDWTLDQLIDWVRSVEPAEPEPAIAESLNSTEVVTEIMRGLQP